MMLVVTSYDCVKVVASPLNGKLLIYKCGLIGLYAELVDGSWMWKTPILVERKLMLSI
jgi:hypothetical protein